MRMKKRKKCLFGNVEDLPGDIMSSIVKVVTGGHNFRTSLNDATQGWSASPSGEDATATKQSAEWVVCCGAPLSKFGRVNSGDRFTNLRDEGKDALNGNKINQWDLIELTMVNPITGHVLATPTQKSSSFYVTFMNAS